MKYLETSLTKEDIKNAREEARNPSQTRQVYDCMLCGWCIIECPEDAITLTPDKKDPLIVSWG